jgi:hypothetical protein
MIIDNEIYTMVSNEMRDDICKDVGSSGILSGKYSNNEHLIVTTN